MKSALTQGGMNNGGNTSKLYRSCHLCRCGRCGKAQNHGKECGGRINEIYQNETQGGSPFGQQWFTGIKSGDTIIFRCFNSINTIIFSTLTVKSVSGNTIYLTDEASAGGSGQYAHQLFPDGIIFIQGSNASYATSSIAGGYYGLASGKYSFADGMHIISAADNAVTFGKYGVNTDSCSLALANGTAIKTPGLAFKVLSDGSVHADKEYTSPCADYAEYFEWGTKIPITRTEPDIL